MCVVPIYIKQKLQVLQTKTPLQTNFQNIKINSMKIGAILVLFTLIWPDKITITKRGIFATFSRYFSFFSFIETRETREESCLPDKEQ